MRFSKFFVYVICTFLIGVSNSVASHSDLAHRPPAPRAASLSQEPFIKTGFYTTEPQGLLIAENNLLSFEEKNADALNALKAIGFFKDPPERDFSDEELTEITKLVYGTLQSKTNIATQFCMIPRELIRDFEGYVETVWDEEHPYSIQAFQTLGSLQTCLENLGKIINFGLGQWGRSSQ